MYAPVNVINLDHDMERMASLAVSLAALGLALTPRPRSAG